LKFTTEIQHIGQQFSEWRSCMRCLVLKVDDICRL